MQIVVYSASASQPPVTATPDQLGALIASEDTVTWVDIEAPVDEDARVLLDVFKFHPLTVEDTRNGRQRPKVEEYPGYVFTIVNTVSRRGDELEFGELDLFLARNYVVSVHTGQGGWVSQARERVTEVCQRQPLTSGYLLYALLDVVVDGFFPVLDDIGDEIEAIEDELLAHPRRAHLGRVYVLKRELSEMWRIAGQQRDMFSVLTRENSVVVNQDALRFYLRDVYDHVLRVSDTVSTFRDMLANVVDLYMSAVSNRLNQQVNRLTVITMSIGVLAVITGFYGMNFERTWPPFSAEWGVPFVLALMVVTTLAFLFLMRGLRS